MENKEEKEIEKVDNDEEEEEYVDSSIMNCILKKEFLFPSILSENKEIKLKINDFYACDTLPLSDAVGLLDGSSDITGMVLWPGSLLFATEFILKYEQLFRGKNVLEVGCGSGFLGVILSRLNWPNRVICTDIGEEVLELAMNNFNTSKGKILSQKDENVVESEGVYSAAFVEELKWGDLESIKALMSKYPNTNVIIGVDVVYNSGNVPLLLDTVDLIFSEKENEKNEKNLEYQQEQQEQRAKQTQTQTQIQTQTQTQTQTTTKTNTNDTTSVEKEEPVDSKVIKLNPKNKNGILILAIDLTFFEAEAILRREAKKRGYKLLNKQKLKAIPYGTNSMDERFVVVLQKKDE